MSRNSDRYQILYELGLAFNSRTNLHELSKVIIDRCREAFDAEGASLLLHDEEADELYFPYVASDKPEVAERLSALRLDASAGIAGRIFREGRAIKIDDARADSGVLQPAEAVDGKVTHNLIGAPLQTNYSTIGVIEIVNRKGGRPFSQADLEFLESLAGTISVAVENSYLAEELQQDRDRLANELTSERRIRSHQSGGFGALLGESKAMKETFTLLESAADVPISVLIYGETGTGKELAARGLHDLGPRASKPFIAINTAALPENLLESELFGHKKGAFTGATRDRIGAFEAADGGTLFLDEVGEMPADMQAKLLRVLQEGEVVPVGDHRPRRIDTRIVSATNRNLEEEIREGRFREDLYYRLATFPVALPSLRERKDDIAALANHLLVRIGERYGRSAPGIADEGMALLESYSWPGNVRELENELERAVALVGSGGRIEADHFSDRLRRPQAGREISTSAPLTTTDLREARALFETGFIRGVLEKHAGNITHTAQALGLSRVGLQKMIKEFGIRGS
jgi:transcriptional regulator with GAF, ATPase, and Fis domain